MRATALIAVASALVLGMLFLIPATVGTAPTRHPTVTVGGGTIASSSGFNRPGNVLITDQFNNRVIEVNPLSKQIVWSFGSGNSTLCNPGPGAIIGSNWAERISGGLTIMAGTGIPSGITGATACVDNRVIVVNHAGKIVWQYGQAGKTGNGTNLLNVPTSAVQLPNHDILITDQGNNRVIEVNLAHHVVWSYGPTSGPGALNTPNSAELLANGHVLIADENNFRVLEVTRAHAIVWEFHHGMAAVAFASRLSNGDTLITDSGHNRIVEVTHAKQLVFHYSTNRSSASNASPLPTNAVRLSNGDTIIADQFNNRVLVIDSAKQIVFQYGVTNVSGGGFNQLFAPYTAFVIGDYTGQTVPPDSFGGEHVGEFEGEE